ncbi:MAG: reverse transcriptase, partial [Alphaproteobacteria bacterium HGW-Alphaproteobacteria-5]
ARLDAYIFSYYRHLLFEPYEKLLKRYNLSGNVLAYRRILGADGRGKCNIHFAKDTFNAVQGLGDCYVVCLDISSYFESLDHLKLKKIWARLLGEQRLPADHFAVFKAITSYSYVDKKEVYERLGFFGDKRKTKSGKSIKGYLKSYKDMPPHLCSPSTFRSEIAGGSKDSIVKKNKDVFGIPQGAPLSDLLANMYLIEFDRQVRTWMRRRGGFYFRYSDDILLIGKGGEKEGRAILKKVQALIPDFGSKLQIKDDKSSLHVFRKAAIGQECDCVLEKGKNGLEYLGFRFDGRNVYLRDSTLSNLNRKMIHIARRRANVLATRYANKNTDEIWKEFNLDSFVQRFHKVEDFDEIKDDIRSWTFWTYTERAAKEFGPLGTKIKSQLRGFREFAEHKARQEVNNAVVRRDAK